MKKDKTLRNVAVALGVFILWANIVSLLLPVEQYGAVIKTVDFATALFALALLIAAFAGAGRRAGTADPENGGREKAPARREKRNPGPGPCEAEDPVPPFTLCMARRNPRNP